MKYFSMFSGIGGFEYGIERGTTNTECVGYSEIDKYAIKVYKEHYPKHQNFGDARKIDPGTIPDFDFLCGGFPCQAFSIAGRRKGFEDTRGTLFFEIARIIEAKRPKLILLENVKGLLNHDKGNTFRTIIQTLQELGYDVQWMVLNSKHFGVPQNRERVFIIGNFRAISRRKILSFQKSSNIIDERIPETEIASSLQHPGHSGGNYRGMNMIGELKQSYSKRSYDTPVEINNFLRENRKEYTISEIANKLELPKTQIEHYFRTDPSRAVPSPEIWLKLKELLGLNSTFDKEVTTVFEKEILFEQTRRVYAGDGVSPTLNTIQAPIIGTLRTHNDGKGFRTIKQNISPTIPARAREDGSGQPIIKQGMDIRRLTPKECERLQGFPDDWTLGGGISDSQRYKMCGNAVTTKVISTIISNYFEDTHDTT